MLSSPVSIGRGLLDAVDDDHVNRTLGRLELQPQLFLDRCEQVRAGIDGWGIDTRRQGTRDASESLNERLAELKRLANASERALRHAVIWRKLSFGTQSAGGSRFVETMLTVIETCRQQSRNVFTYVTSAVQAHFADQPTSSLLPEA